MRRVVVTGLGLVTPLGVGVKTTWKNILAGKSGLVSTKTLPDYNNGWQDIPCKVIGKVPEGSLSDGHWAFEDHFSATEGRRLALFAQYGLVASKEALGDAGFTLDLLNDMDKRRFGVAVGSGIGSFHDIHENSTGFNEKGYKKVQPLFIPKLLTNMAAGNISIKYGLQGPLHTVSTACATGLHAVGDAYNFIKNDYADIMVCGGTESSIHPLALAGFSRARSVVTDYNDTPETASRPFDGGRNGFVLSEGCGIMILEDLEHAKRRGVKDSEIYAEVLGYGLSGDAHHITAPAESGDGAYRAMKMAVDRSGLQPANIDYVNAHATSTVLGDRAENNAIHELFGSSPRQSQLSVSSTKSSIGHLLGAAGAVESVFTIKAVKDSVVPPSINLEKAGGHSSDDAAKFDKFDYTPNLSKEKQINYALCNSFGFGGVNSSVCFGKYP